MQARLLTIIGIVLLSTLTMAQGHQRRTTTSRHRAATASQRKASPDLVLTIKLPTMKVRRGSLLRVKFRLRNRSTRTWYVSKSGTRFGLWIEGHPNTQVGMEDDTAYPPLGRDDYVLLRPGQSVNLTAPELVLLPLGRHRIHGAYTDSYASRRPIQQHPDLRTFYRKEKARVWTKEVDSASITFEVVK